MDSLASLALATEEPKEDLLERPPYRKKEYIISQKMVKHILGMSIFQAIILFVFVFGAPSFMPESCDPLTGPLMATHPLESINSIAPSYSGENLRMLSAAPVEGEAPPVWDVDLMSDCPKLVLNGMVQSLDG